MSDDYYALQKEQNQDMENKDRANIDKAVKQ